MFSFLLLAACFPSVEDTSTYSLIVLKTGPARDLDEEAMGAAMRGHFANMGRLAEEGVLLIAGPLGEPRSDPLHRGIFVFDTDDLDEARELAGTDPAVEAGVFEAEVSTLTSAYPLPELPALGRAARQAREAELRGVPEALRPYCLASSPRPAQAERALAGLAPDQVLFHARMAGGLAGGTDEHLLVLLDVHSADEARELLPEVSGAPGGPGVEWTLHSWYGTSDHVHLPLHARRADAPTFEIEPLPEEGPLAAFRPHFARHVTVFGVEVVATDTVADKNLLHAAHLMAQYIDNDEDGEPDDPRVHRVLVDEGAFLAMDAAQRRHGEVGFDHRALERAGWRMGQDLYDEETRPDGPPHVDGPGRFDAALEEVWHLVSHGWAEAYPEAFAFGAGSRLADAMDLARGGRFERVPTRYPEGAWYHYDDRTCDGWCQAAEYFYWILTTRLGGQDYPGRGREIGNEWQPNTPALLQERDRAAWELLNDPAFALPKVLPDGDYR